MNSGFVWTVICCLFPSLVHAQFRAGGTSFGPRRNTSPYKGYSGYVLSKESQRVVYYYDQTIVLVEVTPKTRDLLNCEIIEVYDESDIKDAMDTLTKEVGEPFLIDMEKMVKLMRQCQLLPTTAKSKFDVRSSAGNEKVKSQANQPSQYSLLNGIIPGTKWCGTGDIADTYFDLGTEIKLDKCCRTHDLCPSKIRANTNRYNINNKSIYTKSHCTCDKIFRSCLKATKSPTADLMGEFYFNIFRVPCIIDAPQGKQFSVPQNY